MPETAINTVHPRLVLSAASQAIVGIGLGVGVSVRSQTEGVARAF
jgi:glucose-6-phosphate-specific signal transduction histidine kinase